METSSRRRIQNVVEKLVGLAEAKREECDAEYEKHILWLRKAFQDNTARFLICNSSVNQAKKYKSMRPSVLNKMNNSEHKKLSEPRTRAEAQTRKRKSDQAKYESRDLLSGALPSKPVDSPNPNPKKKERFRGPNSHKKKGPSNTRSLEAQIADCMKLTVKILRIQLKKAGLSTSGRKAILAERLAQYKLEKETPVAPVQKPDESDLLETREAVKRQQKQEEKVEAAKPVEDPMEEDGPNEAEKDVSKEEPADSTKDPMEVDDAPIRDVVFKDASPVDESKEESVTASTSPAQPVKAEVSTENAVEQSKPASTSDSLPTNEEAAPVRRSPEKQVVEMNDSVVPMESEESQPKLPPPAIVEDNSKTVTVKKAEETWPADEGKTKSLEALRKKNEMKLKALREAKQNAEQAKAATTATAPVRVATPPPPLPPKPLSLKQISKKPEPAPKTLSPRIAAPEPAPTSETAKAEAPPVSVVSTKQQAEEANGQSESDKLRREMEKRLNRERQKSNVEPAKPAEDSRSGTSILGNIVKGLATFTEESRFIKEAVKPKKPTKPISALEKAKIAKEEQEKREEQRRKQREAHRLRMAENKRRKAMEGKNGSSKPTAIRPPMRPALPKPKPAEEAWDPQDNYEISDKGESSSSDDQDSEREAERSKKYIPRWARSKEFKEALRKQYDGPTRIDPDKIFGEIQHCDLEAIFKPRDQKKKKKYKVRGSSAMWTRDGLTIKETKEYKKAMGLV